MNRIVLILATLAVVVAAMPSAPQPAQARRWFDWPNAGYCPPKTCTPLGYWRAANVKNCKPRAWCRWPD